MKNVGALASPFAFIFLVAGAICSSASCSRNDHNIGNESVERQEGAGADRKDEASMVIYEPPIVETPDSPIIPDLSMDCDIVIEEESFFLVLQTTRFQNDAPPLLFSQNFSVKMLTTNGRVLETQTSPPPGAVLEAGLSGGMYAVLRFKLGPRNGVEIEDIAALSVRYKDKEFRLVKVGKSGAADHWESRSDSDL